MDETTLIFSIASIVIAVAGLLFEHFRTISRIESRTTSVETLLNTMVKTLDAVVSRIEKLEDERERLKAVEVKTEVFWNAVQGSVVQMLKHPTAKRKDDLLDRLVDKTITLKELEELKCILQLDLGKKNSESLAAGLMLGRIEQIMYDLRHLPVQAFNHR